MENVNQQSLEQIFLGLAQVKSRNDDDSVYAEQIRTTIKECVVKIATKEHRKQIETFHHIKSKGYSDSEILYIYGLVCGAVGKRSMVIHERT